MMLFVLTGCAKEGLTQAGTVSDFESQTHIQVSTSEDEFVSSDMSKAPVSGEFVVSEKKYDYKDGNIELLYIENQTDRHYDITIHGAYLDGNGETIKEETQTFAGFASGWSNNFIFYPRMAFDSFTYTVETEESTEDSRAVDEYGNQFKVFDNDGNPLVSYIEFSYENKLIWQRGLEPINDSHPDEAKEIRELMMPVKVMNSHQRTSIMCAFFILILNSDGEVFLTSHDYFDGVIGGSSSYLSPPYGMGEETNEYIPIWVQDVGLDETIPSEFTAVFAMIRLFDWDSWANSIL